MSTMVRKGPSLPKLSKLTERACNDPQRMKARKTEAKIIEMMPARAWLSCTAVSRLIGVPDDGKTRARLDRLRRLYLRRGEPREREVRVCLRTCRHDESLQDQ